MAPQAETRTYAAFVSYRHLPLDRQWAQWILESLERFRTPASLVRRGYPARIAPVYRDEDEVPASANLSRHIEDALEASRALIVVCTPDTPASRWIDREVRLFQQSGRGERIHLLLVAGEPQSAFPRPLLEQENCEPVAADVRSRADISDRKLRRMARLRLAAALLGCTFDDLRRRERQRRRRRILAAAVTGLVLFGGGGWLTLDYLRRQETLRMASGMAEAEVWMRERFVESDQHLRASLAFDLLPSRNRLGAPLPADVKSALLPVARSGAVRQVLLFGDSSPTRLLAREGYVLVGTENGGLLRVADHGAVATLSPGGCPVSDDEAYGCAVTAIAESGGTWVIGVVGGMIRLSRPGQDARWVAVSRQRIDQLIGTEAGTLVAADGGGRLFGIGRDGGVTQLSGAGGAVIALLKPPSDPIVVVRARGAIQHLLPDGGLSTLGNLPARIGAAMLAEGRLTLLQEPPLRTSSSLYQPRDDPRRRLFIRRGERWVSIVLADRADVAPPAALYAVSPDDAYAALGLPSEPLWEPGFREAVAGIERRAIWSPSRRMLYRMDSARLAIIDLHRLRQIEAMILAGGNLRGALCREQLGPLFVHRMSRTRPCAGREDPVSSDTARTGSIRRRAHRSAATGEG